MNKTDNYLLMATSILIIALVAMELLVPVGGEEPAATPTAAGGERHTYTPAKINSGATTRLVVIPTYTLATVTVIP